MLELLPYIYDIKDDLSCVKNNLTNLNKTISNLSVTVSDLSGDLEDYKQKTELELAGLQSMFNMSFTSHTEQLTELRAMKSQLEQHKTQTTSELAGLQSKTTILYNTLQSHTQQLTTTMELTQLSSMREDLVCIKKNLSSLSETINVQVEEHNNMTTELMNLDQLQMKFMAKLTFYFGFIIPIHTCGGTGGWRRVVYLDMTDPNTNCPSGWRLTSHSKRTCGRVSTGLACDSVTFPVSGGDYTRVCGRIKGYQSRGTDAFEAYHEGRVTTIDGAYVSGVSLTHGSPRQHIWTFAAGYSEYHPTRNDVCPCDATINIAIPPFAGGDYFCESGRNSGPNAQFFPNDPLWDGDGCTASSTCCSFNNPPYLSKQLLSPTTDDIEVRLCLWEDDDDCPIELIELYVQ